MLRDAAERAFASRTYVVAELLTGGVVIATRLGTQTTMLPDEGLADDSM